MYGSHGGCPLAGRPSRCSQKFMCGSSAKSTPGGNGSRNDGHSCGGGTAGGVASVNSKPGRAAAEHRDRRVAGIGAGRARGRARAARSSGRAASTVTSMSTGPAMHLRREHGRDAAQRLIGIGRARRSSPVPSWRSRARRGARSGSSTPRRCRRGTRRRRVAASLDRGALLELRPDPSRT